MKRIVLLATVAGAYLLAAWMVAPGFYDGFTPPQPYNFVCPPPAAPPTNQSPRSGHLEIKVIKGVSDPNSAFTDDGQVVVSFLPGVFDVTGKTSISVDIKPVSPCPNPLGLHFSTNTYLITASAPLVKDASLELRYSDVVPAPSLIYQAPSPDGAWKSIGGSPGQPFTILTKTRQFGYVAAGYPANATQPAGSGNQWLPIAVAILIVAVLIAGIPLAVLRRRRAAGMDSDEEDDS